MKIVKVLTLALLAMLGAQTTSAQSADETRSYPYGFIGLQGGAQLTFTNYDHTKLITPIGAVQGGVMWTPVVGTRLHVSGIDGKTAVKGLGEFKYKFVTSDLDLMLNLTNMFRKNDSWFDLYAIGGFGLNYNWDHKQVFHALPENHFSHNFRLGLLADFNITRRLSVGLELDANNLADRFNAKINNSNDWQATAMLGITYKIRCGKPAPAPVVIPAPVVAPAPAPEPEPVIDIAPAPAPAPAPVVKKEMVKNVFFQINSAKISAAELLKVNEVADFLNANPNAKVAITGYADKGTGNAVINQRLSVQRANAVYNALLKQNIAASRIIKDAKGDTVQPFANNDDNRVVICIAE